MKFIDPNNSFNGIFSNSFLVLSDLRTKLPHLLKQFPQFSKEQIEDIANQFDPTNNKFYITWILKQIINGSLRITNNNGILEDATIVNRRLSQFDKIKNRDFFTHNKDINKYSTPKDLYQTLDLYKEYLQDVDRKEQYKEDKKVLEEKGYTEVYNTSPFKILKVVSVPVAMEFASGTDWCVQDEDSAKHYLKDGPLYFIYKNGEKYALLHVESQQLKDTHDEELDHEYREELEPIFVDNGIINEITYQYLILNNEHKYKPTESEIQYLKKDPHMAFKYAMVIGKPFLDGEPAIATNPTYSYEYAAEVLKPNGIIGFPLGEDAIATDTFCSTQYATLVIKKPFPKGEEAIAKKYYLAFTYALNILKPAGIIGFPLAEDNISKDPSYSLLYAKYIIEKPFPKGEESIASMDRTAYEYAEEVLHDRFLLGEKSIFNSGYENRYLEFLKEKGYDIDQIKREWT